MTKDELKRYKYIGDEIAQLREEINRLRDGLMSPSGKVITWAPAAAKQDDKFADVMARMDELEHILKDKLLERLQLQTDIERAISSVSDPRIRILLRSRYIQDKSWKEICKQLNYSYRQVQNLHGQGLRLIS